MTRVLGPTMMYTESAAIAVVPPLPGKVGVQFDPSKALTPGGIVNLQLLAPVDPSDEVPSLIEAMYVPQALIPSPVTLEAVDTLTGLSTVAYSVPTPPPTPLTTFSVSVAPPPVPGVYLVVTAITYPT